MKKNKLFALSMPIFLSTLVGCASAITIPDTEIYKEIPFLDGAEGISYKIRSEAVLSYPPKLWEQKVPELVCVDADGWYEIKKSWIDACRYAGKNCDLEIETVESTIRALDDLAKKIIQGQKAIKD